MSHKATDHYREVMLESFKEAMEAITDRENLEEQMRHWWDQQDQDEQFINEQEQTPWDVK